MEVNTKTKIKAVLNVATVSNFQISMIQHHGRQSQKKVGQPPTKNLRQNNVDHVVLYIQWKMYQFKNK
jgi:hypothetical protein